MKKKKAVVTVLFGIIAVSICIWLAIPRSLEDITDIRKDDICSAYGQYLLQYVEDGQTIEDFNEFRFEISDEEKIKELWEALKNGKYMQNIRNIVPLEGRKEVSTTLYVIFETPDTQVYMYISPSGKVQIRTDTSAYLYTATDSEVYDNLIRFIKENHSD